MDVSGGFSSGNSADPSRGVAEPTMFARIDVMLASDRHAGRGFNPARRDCMGKLARDRPVDEHISVARRDLKFWGALLWSWGDPEWELRQ
jgi:hypothetical protein